VNDKQAEEIAITISDEAVGGPEQLERATQQLRRAIRELPVDAVEPIRAPVGGVEGAKAIDGALIGTLAVKLLPQVVPMLCDVLRQWLKRGSNRRLTIACGETKIDITGELTPDQTAAIVQAMTRKRSQAHMN
jgi:hypothetical protein